MSKINKKNQLLFSEVRDKFNKWRFSMLLCAVVYVASFLVAKVLIEWLIRPYADCWLSQSKNLTILAAGTIVGFAFYADSKVSSFLKTPLQRLAMKIESSGVEESEKKKLLELTQEASELFRKTFEKFGIIAVVGLIAGIIDNGEVAAVSEKVVNGHTVYTRLGRVIKGRIIPNPDQDSSEVLIEKITGKNSENILFYVCYLIPIIFAAFRIWEISRKLNDIETSYQEDDNDNKGKPEKKNGQSTPKLGKPESPKVIEVFGRRLVFQNKKWKWEDEENKRVKIERKNHKSLKRGL